MIAWKEIRITAIYSDKIETEKLLQYVVNSEEDFQLLAIALQIDKVL